MTDKDNVHHVNRRRVLQGVGGAGAAMLAGCAGGGGGDGDGGGGGGGSGDGNGSGGGSTADGNDSGGGSGSSGGKLKMALVKSPLDFDPFVANDVPSTQVIDRIVEGLYTYDETTGVVPLLADGEPEVNDDGTEYTVTIKDGATFSNGDPVTAEDVKYSFLAPVEEETENASELNMIDSIETSDKSVTFTLKYPYAPFPNTLTWYVVPKAVREEDKDAFNSGEALVGSGPYTFESWQEGDYARITKNADYWDEPAANLDEVEFVPVEEATTRVTTLKNGENDIIEEIPPKQYPTVEAISDASIDEVPGIGYFYLAFNCKTGPTTDPKVREAIDYTFDMDSAVSNYVEPTGVRQYSPLPKSIAEDWGMPLDEWKQIPHDKDVDKAASMLEEAGVEKGYQFKVIVPPDDKREQIGITVSNGLKEAGYNCSVQRLDWGAFLDKYVSGDENDYNMYTLGWSGTPDPDAFTYYLFGRTEDTLGVTNGTYWGDNSEAGKQAAEKFVQARQTGSEEERKTLYQEGITTALEERAHLPAYNLKNSFGVKDYVKDFTSHPVSSFTLTTDYNNVSVDK
ncbi:ABC transporter substrate-binding protein [Halomarina salina]|uniref:ABC transporter substrate-binding protein n=1 Tax=Halomarina salina TaxID=1872699 RepID=A0ABD5RP37_9EURY|nr:ABC transporter substrate-binding protein [Halomarina salina]